MPKLSLTHAPRWRALAALLGAIPILLVGCATALRAQQAAGDKLDVDPVVLDELVAANRILAHRGVLDAFGHISIRNPNNPSHYLMSRWIAPGLVTAEDIVEIRSRQPCAHPARQAALFRALHSWRDLQGPSRREGDRP